MDIESGEDSVKGWYSETSIQNILYDIYDDSSDDEVSLGLKPIYSVLRNGQRSTKAFTSIFTIY